MATVPPVAAGAPAVPAAPDIKGQLLRLEEPLRRSADARLTGIPGRPVVVLGCSAEACAKGHRVRISGVDEAEIARRLSAAFAEGGWVALALDGRPGGSVTLNWEMSGEKPLSAAITLPPAGSVVLVEPTEKALLVHPPQTPDADMVHRVALGDRARGDLLGAAAVLAVAPGTLPIPDQLLLADVYREAGIDAPAADIYAALAEHPDAGVKLRVRIGQAYLELEKNPSATLKTLGALKPPAGTSLAAEAATLQIAALRRTEAAHALISALPPAGGDAFVLAARAQAFVAVGDPFSAIREYDDAARLATGTAPEISALRERALLAAASLFAEQGRSAEALQRFDAISAGEIADRVRFGRAVAFLRGGDLVKSVAEINAMERERPESAYLPEGRLMKAEIYRRLNVPYQAVAEYRKALSAFRERTRQLEALIVTVRGGPFGQGLTGHLFAPQRTGDIPPVGIEGVAIQVLARHPALVAAVADHHQVAFTLERLEQVAIGSSAGGDAGRGAALRDKVTALRGGLEAGAREQVTTLLEAERVRLSDLSIAAAVGITQSVLSDQTGARDLVFEEPRGK
ncbi:MAG: hypothetical protein OEW11_02375 [Nitrospirota bacterium]|nr:hypothetical protein [Nitrospirota bacterium]